MAFKNLIDNCNQNKLFMKKKHFEYIYQVKLIQFNVKFFI